VRIDLKMKKAEALDNVKSQKSYLFKNALFEERDESAKTVFAGPGELGIGPAPEFCANTKGGREYAVDK